MARPLKIKELRPGMENANLRVTIAKLNEPRKVTTYTGLEHALVDGEVGDETGRAVITVWDGAIEQLRGISVDDPVELLNCFITSFKRVIHINVGRDSRIIRLNQNEPNDAR